MSQAALPQTVTELLRRIDAEWAGYQGALADLADTDLLAPRPPEGWSLKDHIAHVAAWEQGIAGLLSRAPRWQSMGVDPDTLAEPGVDGLNAAVMALHREQPLEEVRAMATAAHARAREVIAGLSDADLSRPYSDFDPAERRFDTSGPILRTIVDDTYEHYADHNEWLRRPANSYSTEQNS